MARTTAQPQVKLSLLRINSLKPELLTMHLRIIDTGKQLNVGVKKVANISENFRIFLFTMKKCNTKHTNLL